MLTRMARMARLLTRITRMLTRMTRWLASSHIIHTLQGASESCERQIYLLGRL